jgi:hypothetical protein
VVPELDIDDACATSRSGMDESAGPAALGRTTRLAELESRAANLEWNDGIPAPSVLPKPSRDSNAVAA